MESTNANRDALEIEKLRSEISKLIAETSKINRETHWYPVVVAGSIIGGTAAILTAIAAVLSRILG